MQLSPIFQSQSFNAFQSLRSERPTINGIAVFLRFGTTERVVSKGLDFQAPLDPFFIILVCFYNTGTGGGRPLVPLLLMPPSH